jgi:hypothetical protein
MLSLSKHLYRAVRLLPLLAWQRCFGKLSMTLFNYLIVYKTITYTSSVPGTSGSLLTVAGRFLPRTCTKICVPGAASSVFT